MPPPPRAPAAAASAADLAPYTRFTLTPMPSELRKGLCQYLLAETRRLGVSLERATLQDMCAGVADDKKLLWVWRKFDIADDKVTKALSGMTFPKYQALPGYNCFLPPALRDMLAHSQQKQVSRQRRHAVAA